MQGSLSILVTLASLLWRAELIPVRPHNVIWTKDANHAIRGSSIDTGVPLNLDDCKARCLNTPGCLSIDYKVHKGGHCWMNKKNKADAGDDFVQTSDGYDYYEWQAAPTNCSTDQFDCGASQCVPASFQCDGALDCENGVDEWGCTCPDDQFQCSSGRCLPGTFRCDVDRDCEGGEDEDNCDGIYWTMDVAHAIRHSTIGNLKGETMKLQDCRDHCLNTPGCLSVDYQVNKGSCFMNNKNKANAGADFVATSDGYDYHEWVYEKPCLVADSFHCRFTGKCIHPSAVCDVDVDCEAAEDEVNCTYTCPDGFQCNDLRCLPLQYVCDGYPDCAGGEDELGCTTTTTSTTTTTNTPATISTTTTTTPTTATRTTTTSTTASQTTTSSRTSACVDDQFECNDGSCILPEYVCDFYDDCLSGEDEEDCLNTPCGLDWFKCPSNGRCIRPGFLCDGDPDCQEGEDEANCSTN